MVSKEAVNYRESTGKRKCGNCVMFHPSNSLSAIELRGSCDLVTGEIRAENVCDRWESKT